MTDRGEGPPNGPFGPGWSNDPDHYRGIDWGASADREPRPRTTRNAAVATGLTGALAAVVSLSDWLDGDFRWSNTLLAVSQICLSIALFLEYRQVLRRAGPE